MKAIPRLRFAHLPTPIEPLPRLSAALGGVNLLIKRDDQTGLALGGNKTRKLEFLVAEAQANGARTLISAGAAQSNHCRQTAAAAARYGFPCKLVLYPPQPTDQPPAPGQPPDGNLLLDHLLGAEVIWTTRPQRDAALQAVFQASWEAGERPYLIPYGGSSPTGAAGYVYAMQEALAQGVQADWMVFASSSGGTHAGLALGARLFGYTGKVLGISIDEPHDKLTAHVAQLAGQAADLLGERQSFVAADILANCDYLGGGYGVLGETEREAVGLFGRLEGILLDPVYTGRAAGGLLDLARRGFFPAGSTVLFWHTGGAPALFANKYNELVG
ncbi:MAG: D-cysteine desulfhydrase family protein [Chloroflexota bacterium]